MSKRVHDIFAIVINFLSNDWEAKHVIIGLFELTYTSGAPMALKLQQFLDMFSLIEKLLLMWNMNGPICKLMQMLWIQLYHVIY